MTAKSTGARHNVYVILLKPGAARHSKVLQQNPKRDSLRPFVYVGMTGLTVDQRFLNHKNGHKSSWVVKRYGDQLLPELYEHLNPCRMRRRWKWKGTWPKICEIRATPS